jgi:predicted TIM-barrel fold metal-dependent hydrolase
MSQSINIRPIAASVQPQFFHSTRMSKIFQGVICFLILLFSVASSAEEQYPMPTPILIAKRTAIQKAKYPAIDVHFHAGDWFSAEAMVEKMDAYGIGIIVNLDGGFGENLDVAQANAAPFRDRLVNFARVDWEGINEEGWSERAAHTLKESFEAGANGLKILKKLGIELQNEDGSYILPDDPRLKLIWAACAKAGRPVLIHSSDPPARWRPVGPDNERYEAGMWRTNSEGNYYDTDLPHFTEILDAQERLFAQNPETTFIAAHVASRGWNLEEVERLLEAYPNFNVDMSARLQELGRQPYSARRFFIRHADRILYGSDGNPGREGDFHTTHWRFLETDDEYFDHPAQMKNALGAGLQGRWKIHGIFLPDDVLKKVYYQNALKLIPGLRALYPGE